MVRITQTTHKSTCLPTITCSTSVQSFLIRFQMSIVKMVEDELKMLVNELIRAAIITLSIKPIAPGGIKLSTSMG